jgi:hypothetical protein
MTSKDDIIKVQQDIIRKLRKSTIAWIDVLEMAKLKIQLDKNNFLSNQLPTIGHNRALTIIDDIIQTTLEEEEYGLR